MYVFIRIIHISYAKGVDRKLNRGDSIIPATRKRQDETNDVQIEFRKREGREDKEIK